MIEVSISEDYMRHAREKASTVGILQGSITGGTSNVVGAIGEVIVADIIGATEANTYNYDLVFFFNITIVPIQECLVVSKTHQLICSRSIAPALLLGSHKVMLCYGVQNFFDFEVIP